MNYTCIDLAGFPLFRDFLSRLQQDQFDAILIDSLQDEAFSACGYLIKNSNLPIALLIREREVNWKKLASWEVDCFISDEATNREMAARIVAVARRKNKIPVAQA
ncbi:MAG: hypothetical protein JXA46_07370 [Dehalococcoidales bacterium]|nr:hypothetical protein [Dehalococcoidales bacterium]